MNKTLQTIIASQLLAAGLCGVAQAEYIPNQCSKAQMSQMSVFYEQQLIEKKQNYECVSKAKPEEITIIGNDCQEFTWPFYPGKSYFGYCKESGTKESVYGKYSPTLNKYCLPEDKSCFPIKKIPCGRLNRLLGKC